MAKRRDFLLGAAASSLLRPHRPVLQSPRRAICERIFLESFGLADVENAVPVTDSTVFQVALCTKAFVGVAAMQLVEAGKLQLDAPYRAI